MAEIGALLVVHQRAGRVVEVGYQIGDFRGDRLLLGGVALNALATALYIGSQFGPGPRDGLMIGLVRRTGWSVRVVRTSLELTVIAVGWLLGGIVGVGTIVYALAIGRLVQLLLPMFIVGLDSRDAVPSGCSGDQDV